MDSTQPQMQFTIDGEPPVTITVTETGDGGLHFAIAVDESGGVTADLNGIFFDFADPAKVDGLMADGSEVTNTEFAYDDVDNLGGGVNIKGELVNETDLFDAGVRVGTSGMSKDDIQTSEFTLSHDTEALTLEDIANMDFGIRLTSVGEIGGNRDGSLKLGGTSPDYVAPTPDGGELQPENPDGDQPREEVDTGGDEFDFDLGGGVDPILIDDDLLNPDAGGDPLFVGDDALLVPDDPLLASDPVPLPKDDFLFG